MGVRHSSGVEPPDDLVRRVGELPQRHKNWPPIGERSFVKAYLDGEIRFCVRPRRDAAQWSAVFQHAPLENPMRFGVMPPASNVKGADFDVGVHHPLMLSDAVKVVQGVERVIPSLVWLELLDDRAVGLGKPAYFFDDWPTTIGTGVESFMAGGDGKVSISWPYVAVSLGQCDGQDVQAAPNHIENCASLRIDHGVQFRHHGRLDDFVSGISISLSDSAVWISALPCNNSFSQGADLGYGPI